MTCTVSAFVAEAAEAKKSIANGWDSRWFDYDRPDGLVVVAETPTAAQVDYTQRPRPVSDRAASLKPSKDAQPRAAGPLDIVHLHSSTPPATSCPRCSAPPKARRALSRSYLRARPGQQQGAGLRPGGTRHGGARLRGPRGRHAPPRRARRATLAPSSTEATSPSPSSSSGRPSWTIDLAETPSELDTKNGVVAVGYSMGSWIHSVVGPADERDAGGGAMVGGARDVPPAALLLPQLAASDPRLAIAHFAGRPLLMLAGKNDCVVTPDMVKHLYDAAQEPRELRWYEGGHLLPSVAYEDAASWIATTVPDTEKKAPRKRGG